MDESDFIPPSLPSNARESRRGRPAGPRLGPSRGALAVPLGILAAALFLPIWFWFFWRIEPGPGEIAVLIRKTGTDLPSGQLLALEKGQKGIQLEVLAEGRWFKNPYAWDWEIRQITDIPAAKLACYAALRPGPFPGGQILAAGRLQRASSQGAGPRQAPGPPLLAYGGSPSSPRSRSAGLRGGVRRLVGKGRAQRRPAGGRVRKRFSSSRMGLKGVLPGILVRGHLLSHPYMVVSRSDLQSQRFELSAWTR
jgi:hypothetical protein